MTPSVTILGGSTLPALSTERYARVCWPSPLIGRGSYTGWVAAPSSQYSE